MPAALRRDAEPHMKREGGLDRLGGDEETRQRDGCEHDDEADLAHSQRFGCACRLHSEPPVHFAENAAVKWTMGPACVLIHVNGRIISSCVRLIPAASNGAHCSFS